MSSGASPGYADRGRKGASGVRAQEDLGGTLGADIGDVWIRDAAKTAAVGQRGDLADIGPAHRPIQVISPVERLVEELGADEHPSRVNRVQLEGLDELVGVVDVVEEPLPPVPLMIRSRRCWSINWWALLNVALVKKLPKSPS